LKRQLLESSESSAVTKNTSGAMQVTQIAVFGEGEELFLREGIRVFEAIRSEKLVFNNYASLIECINTIQDENNAKRMNY
jgi:hypothetical protein